MKKSVSILSVLIFYAVIHTNVSVAGWLELGNNAFFDASNIVYTRRDTILIWLKDTLEISEIYNRLAQKDDDYNKYSNYSDYSFSVEQFEYDCNNKLMRLTIVYDYDKYNRVINRTYDFESKFTPVVPDSKSEYRLNELCNYANIHKPKDYLDQRDLPLPDVFTPKMNSRPGKWSPP